MCDFESSTALHVEQIEMSSATARFILNMQTKLNVEPRDIYLLPGTGSSECTPLARKKRSHDAKGWCCLHHAGLLGRTQQIVFPSIMWYLQSLISTDICVLCHIVQNSETTSYDNDLRPFVFQLAGPSSTLCKTPTRMSPLTRVIGRSMVQSSIQTSRGRRLSY